MVPLWLYNLHELEKQVTTNFNTLPKQALEDFLDGISIPQIDGTKFRLNTTAKEMPKIANSQLETMSSALKNISEKFKFDKDFVEIVKKSAESSEKSAESSDYNLMDLPNRQKQILECMALGKEYSTEEIAGKIGLKGPRTRQLLNELVAMGFVSCTAATKNRRYVRIDNHL